MMSGVLDSRHRQPSKKVKTTGETDALENNSSSEGVPARRFVFKTASQRIAAIDIIGNICIAKEIPEGAACFTIHTIRHWQEICCARDFTVFVRDNETKCQTLTQLVHHKEHLINTLVTQLCGAESYSIAALLAVLKAIAHDLGSEFLPYLRLVIDAFARLASSSISDDPVILENIFECLAFLCKLFVTQLVGNLPDFLRNTSVLRLHKRVHVRRLAAAVIGFVLRLAPSSAFRAVYTQLTLDITKLLERAHNETKDEVTQLLFSSIFSAANELHSRALERIEILYSFLIFDRSACSIDARCAIAAQMFDHIFERACGPETVSNVWAVIMKLLERTLTDSSASTMLTIAVASRSVQHVTSADLNRVILVFNHHIRNPDDESSQNIACFLEFGQIFITTLAGVQLKEEFMPSATHSIPWSLLMPSNRPEVAIKLLESLVESAATHDTPLRMSLISMSLEVAYPSLAESGNGTLPLIREVSTYLRHTKHSILDYGLLKAIASNMKHGVPGAMKYGHPLHAIYLLPHAAISAICNDDLLETFDQCLSSSKRWSEDNIERAFHVAVITACIESIIISVDRNHDLRIIQATARRVLQFAFIESASPRAWVSIAAFVKTYPVEVQEYEDELRTHIVEPCLRMIKHPDKLLRTACISILQIIARCRRANIKTIRGVVELKPELDIFHEMHAFKSTEGNVLLHMRHCMSVLAKLASPGRLSLKAESELNILTHLCLGALRIRLSANWQGLLAYLTALCNKCQAGVSIVIKDIKVTQTRCLSQCMSLPAPLDSINQFRTEYSVLDELNEDNYTDDWIYLDLLLRSLLKCDRREQISALVGEMFLKYIAVVDHVDRTQRRVYDRCLHAWLLLFKGLQGGSKVQSVNLKNALECLVTYNNEMVAKEALNCLEFWELSYLTSDTVSYVKLLVDVKVFKQTVTSRPLRFAEALDDRQSFHISAELRPGLVPILVGVLSTHTRRADKKVRLTAFMNLCMFNTEEILPVFAQSIVGITKSCCRSEIIMNLKKTIDGDMSIKEWEISTDQLRSCQKSALGFLLNVQAFSRFLSTQLRKCLIPFSVIACKLFGMGLASEIAQEMPEQIETHVQGKGHVSKLVRKINAAVILDMIERFNIHTSGYWYLISTPLMKLGSTLHSQVSLPIVPVFLRISLAISSGQDMMKRQDVQNMVIIAIDCLNSAEISEPCCTCIFNILDNVLLHYYQVLTENGAVEADHFLKKRTDILRTVLYQLKSRMHRCKIPGSLESSAMLRLFRQLVSFYHVEDLQKANISDDIADLLVNSKRVSDDHFIELVTILVSILRRCSAFEHDCEHVKSRLSCFFGKLRSKRGREALISLYELPSAIETDVSRILKGLQAMDVHKIDEPDYKVRLETYSGLTSDWFTSMEASSIYPIMYQCIFEFRCGDFLLCKAARHTIFQLATALKKLSLRSASKYESPLYKILVDTVNSSLPALLEHNFAAVRAEGIAVLSGLIEIIPDMYGGFSDLVSYSRLDSNFFTNISHIQIRRQCEALRELTRFLQERSCSSLSMSSYVLPMLKGFLLSESQDVKESSLMAVVACLPHMAWGSYIIEVQKVFKKRAVQSDAWLRCLCYLVIYMNDVNSKSPAPSMVTPETKSSAVLYLRSNILPFMETQMVCEEGVSNKGVVRPVVAHAACAIICAIDTVDREHLFHKLVVRIAEAFKSRSQKVRDAGRNAFVKIGSLAPPKMIAIAIDVVSRQLNKGFTRHVRKAVVFSILKSCIQRLTDSDFSDILPAIIQIINDDIFGEAEGKERDVDFRNSAYKEARKAYDMQIIIQVFSRVYDGETMVFAMKPISMCMSSQLTSSMGMKLKLFLESLRRGIAMNTLISRQTIITIFFSTLADCVRVMHSLRDDRSIQVPGASSVASLGHISMSHQSLNLENIGVMANFALDILDDTLSQSSGLSLEDIESGFVVLLDCLIHCGDLQSRVLKAIARIGRLVPAIFGRYIGILTKQVMCVLKGSCEPMTQNACFRVLVVMFRSDDNLMPSSECCSLIIRLTMSQLLHSLISKSNVAILRVLMGKRIAILQLYEVVEKLIDLNVTGADVRVRASCSKLIVQFMLTYPLGERKFQHLVDTMLPNLAYASAHGRLSILATISALVTKLPIEALQRQAKILLLTFLTRLSSDTDRTCRQLCIHSAVILIKRTSSESGTLLAILQRLFSVGNDALTQSAMQVLRVCLLEVPRAIDTYREIQGSLVIALDNYSRQVACEYKWSGLYSTLLLFETALVFDTSLADDIDDGYMSSILLKLLQYPHFWVQLSVSRVISLYLTGRHAGDAGERLSARSPHYLKTLIVSHIGILEYVARTKMAEQSMKLCGAIFKNIITASSILLHGNSKCVLQQHLRQEKYFEGCTILKYLKRFSQSKDELLQEIALRLVAGLAGPLKDCVESNEDVLGIFVDICSSDLYRNRGTQKLAGEVAKCISTYVSSTKWALAVSQSKGRNCASGS